MKNSARLELSFVSWQDPSLFKVSFTHPLVRETILSVRGKTSGVFDTFRTFQWTSAVQALVVVLLRAVTSHRASTISTTSKLLEGGIGSLAASLSYALDKQPVWLLDMFGTNSDGSPLIKRLLHRSNLGSSRKGPVAFDINRALLRAEDIHLYVEDCRITDSAKLNEFRHILELKLGIRSNSDAEGSDSSASALSTDNRPETHREPHTAFKTPFLSLSRSGGQPTFTRVYEDGSATALVAVFGDLVQLHREKPTLVRAQFDCVFGGVLQSTSCDCDYQLRKAIQTLEKEGGILIYLYNHSAGKRLFSTHFDASKRLPALTGGTSSYLPDAEVRSDEMKLLELVPTILKDLGARNVTLLTNSSEKLEVLRNAGIHASESRLIAPLSPQNISHLYGKIRSGRHALDELLPEQGDLFIARSPDVCRNFEKVWIFAGEDLLWEDNIYYQDLIRQFIDQVAARAHAMTRADIRGLVDSISASNAKSIGFGPRVFEKSLRQVFELIQTKHHGKIAYPEVLLSDVAARIIESPVRASGEGEWLVHHLKRAGHGLVLLTQGPIDVEVDKFARLSIAAQFDSFAVVERKSKDSFRRLIDTLAVPADKVVVIGNSIGFEIAPAVELGLEAVYYNNPNSWAFTNHENEVAGRYHEITDLRHAANLVFHKFSDTEKRIHQHNGSPTDFAA